MNGPGTSAAVCNRCEPFAGCRRAVADRTKAIVDCCRPLPCVYPPDSVHHGFGNHVEEPVCKPRHLMHVDERFGAAQTLGVVEDPLPVDKATGSPEHRVRCS
jgi:hypothetical protein